MKFVEKVKNPKALQDYIERIEADQINFRKFIIKQYQGEYYIESAIISVSDEGIITSSDKKYLPTDQEQDAIIEEFKKIEFPKQILAKQANLTSLKNKISKKSSLYEFWTFDRKSLVMVQEKRIDKNGSKKYIPWTFFSDGVWRALEPENGLPLWKPKKSRNKSRIMIHEGAKAAQFIDGLVNDKTRKKELEQHPFGEEFELYEHWGLIGGALAPQRTDFDDLIKAKPTGTVYVCDNDTAGKSALQVVSKIYKKPLEGLFFDDHFPISFDFADEMPKELFNSNGVYNGPSFDGLLRPATWATVKVQGDGKGKTHYKLSQHFLNEWSHSVSPDAYVLNKHPSDIYTTEVFNDLVAPFSHVDNTARLFKKLESQKAKVISYSPAKKTGIFSEAGRMSKTFINTFEPGHLKPMKGDASLFVDFMKNLFPVKDDREAVLKWVATLIARPDIKMNYGLMLISQMQGVGKTTLGESIIAPIIGMHNASFPSETDIVDSQFNEWAAHKRLAIVNEIYAGNSDKPYNKLKSIIADKNILINKKFQSAYLIENWLHMFACSNSIRCLKLDNDDRRWLLPRVTERQRDGGFWSHFYTWLNQRNGLEIIYNYLIDYCEKNGPVYKNDHAPTTQWKQEVIEDTLGHDSALVVDLLNSLRQKNGDNLTILTDQDIVNYIRNQHYDGKMGVKILKPLTIRKLAKNHGWFVSNYKTRYSPELGIFTKMTHFLGSDPTILTLNEDDFRPEIITKVDDFFLDDVSI